MRNDNYYKQTEYNNGHYNKPEHSKKSNQKEKEESEYELRCGVVEIGCNRTATYLCSRCGRPLCDNEFCHWVIQEDYRESFAPLDNPEKPPSINNRPTKAYYCLDCLEIKFDFERKPSFFGSLFNSTLKKIRNKINRLEKRRKRG